MTKELRFLDPEAFDCLCFVCRDKLRGRDEYVELQALLEIIDDEDQLGFEQDMYEDDFIGEFGNVLYDTYGPCDQCRDNYQAEWNSSDKTWLRQGFRNIPNRIQRQRSHEGVRNFFTDESEFCWFIKPMLVYCRIAYPGQTPSLDRYCPSHYPSLRDRIPYAPIYVRVIPNSINSGIASRKITEKEFTMIHSLRAFGWTQRRIALVLGRSTSTVCRALKREYTLTLGIE